LPKLERLVVPMLLLAGCTSIDYRAGPVPGLEGLTVEEHHVEASEIYARCSSCGSFGPVLPNACTCVNFRTRRAVIWLAHGASDETVEHERAHARGYDHHGGELQRQFTAWVRSQATYQADAGSTPPVR
jgi:hypothetical protein